MGSALVRFSQAADSRSAGDARPEFANVKSFLIGYKCAVVAENLACTHETKQTIIPRRILMVESAPREKDPIQRCCNKSSYPGFGSVAGEPRILVDPS